MKVDILPRLLRLTAVVVLAAWAVPASAQQPQPLLDANGEVLEEAYDYLSRPLSSGRRSTGNSPPPGATAN